jgi:hypothetical protein
MQFKVFVKSLSLKFSGKIKGKDWQEVSSLNALLTRNTRDGWRLNRMIATQFGPGIVYTAVFEHDD